jgi:hypothetical protein
MIRANCRDRFTEDDFAFIVNSLATTESKRVALADLLSDQESRDQVLDDETLFARLVDSSVFKQISSRLYFYVLTRRAFVEADIDDRDMTDYVASMLAEFCNSKSVHSVQESDEQKQYHYLVDLLSDAFASSSVEAFFLRSHLANYALFMTGVFPDLIYRRATYGRKAPGFEYYEQMGKSSYQWASQHRLALEYRLVEVMANLSMRFRHVRVALNNLADKYFNLDHRSDRLDKMLRQIFFGNHNSNNFEA